MPRFPGYNIRNPAFGLAVAFEFHEARPEPLISGFVQASCGPWLPAGCVINKVSISTSRFQGGGDTVANDQLGNGSAGPQKHVQVEDIKRRKQVKFHINGKGSSRAWKTCNRTARLTVSSCSIVSTRTSKLSIRLACSKSFLGLFCPFLVGGSVDLRFSMTARYSSRVDETALNDALNLQGFVDT